jgi:hypothetical protein
LGFGEHADRAERSDLVAHLAHAAGIGHGVRTDQYRAYGAQAERLLEILERIVKHDEGPVFHRSELRGEFCRQGVDALHGLFGIGPILRGMLRIHRFQRVCGAADDDLGIGRREPEMAVETACVRLVMCVWRCGLQGGHRAPALLLAASAGRQQVRARLGGQSDDTGAFWQGLGDLDQCRLNIGPDPEQKLRLLGCRVLGRLEGVSVRRTARWDQHGGVPTPAITAATRSPTGLMLTATLGAV